MVLAIVASDPFLPKGSLMGTAPLSKPLPAGNGNRPHRPFDAPRKSCVVQALLPNSQTTLQQLILLQDWQRVLIRAKLFPNELRQPLRMTLYSLSIQVLPLHLVCTLQPPSTVVDIFLQLYLDAAGTPVVTWRGSKNVKKKKRRLHFRNWRRAGASQEDAEQLLPDAESEVSKWPVDDSVSIEPSMADLASLCSLTEKSAVLQLSPSGGLTRLQLNDSQETQSTKSSVFCVDWDLRPLVELVQQREGELLPLHLACLYRCSPKVIEALVNKYPFAALCEVMGMLPIHLVAAGWTLSPIQSRPSSPIPEEKPSQADMLRVLRVLPETLSALSLNHEMTAIEYVEQCMEEGSAKDECIALLTCDSDEEESSTNDQVSVASLVFVDSSDSSKVEYEHIAGLSTLLKSANWEGALEIVEDSPRCASQWLYGVENERVWKRLPLHLACVYGAPIGLIDLLIKTYKEGSSLADDAGCLALHYACRHGASLPTVELLLCECPEATCAVDNQGRLPLHWAVMEAPYVVIERLVDVDPQAIAMLDSDGQSCIDLAQEDVVVELLTMVVIFMERSVWRNEAEV